MKLDPGMHMVMHLIFFGKAGVTMDDPEARVKSSLSDCTWLEDLSMNLSSRHLRTYESKRIEEHLYYFSYFYFISFSFFSLSFFLSFFLIPFFLLFFSSHHNNFFSFFIFFLLLLRTFAT
jgi:hypothetical protein